MTLRIFDTSFRATENISYTNETQTVVINTSIVADDRIITIRAKSVLLLANAYIQAKEVRVTCSDVFVTIGTIDTDRQVIDASEAFIGGWSTTEEDNIEITAYQYPTFGTDTAFQKLQNIMFSACRSEVPYLQSCHHEALKGPGNYP